MNITDILNEAMNREASDVFLVAGLPLTFKVNGHQQRQDVPLMSKEVWELIQQLYEHSGKNVAVVESGNQDDDFSFAIPSLGRFRANVFHQRGSLAAVLRVIKFGMPDPVALGIPEQVLNAAHLRNGLVLVTGPAGSGKSTTLACLIDSINKTHEGHIITMEDPIEFIHRHEKCIVTQREIGGDVPSYVQALRSALRESPDVILLGEMRDYETIDVAMAAAETGQLLFSTLHTTGAASTVDRIVDVFPATEQDQVRLQLSMVLSAVISQQLVPTVDGGQTVAFEVMYANVAIKNLIREGKSHQIDAAIQNGAAQGMCTMDSSLCTLARDGRITRETALVYSVHREAVEKKLATIR